MAKYAYKYKAWDIYAKRIISHQELYFASPKTFNDLFDCQAHGIIKDYNPPCDPFSIDEKGKFHFYKIDPIALLNDATKRGIETCGVCCFSKSYDSILMWSHYADYNRGVCFRFDLNKIKLAIGLFSDIIYVKNKPTYDYNNPNEDKSKWFFYKNSVWKYEKEIRGLIFPPKNIKSQRYRKVKFPKEALKEIILGANYLDKRTHDEVISLCMEHGFNNVQFSIMQPTTNTDSYKLIKVPLPVTN